jgi:hypothetical protein
MARKSSGSLKGISLTELQQELRRRQAGASSLIRKRDTLAAKLAKIDAELAGLGIQGGRVAKGAPVAGGRKRPINDMNLVEYLQKVLKGKTMGVTEAANAVMKAGYKTTAANFRTIVNQTLIKHKTIFKKVQRGQYTAA